jgi:hypothetical protein
MRRKTTKSNKNTAVIRLNKLFDINNERGLPKWEMTGYRDGEEGVVGRGGTSGAGRAASGLFFRILVVIVTTAFLWVQLNNNMDNSNSKPAGKKVVEINFIWL